MSPPPSVRHGAVGGGFGRWTRAQRLPPPPPHRLWLVALERDLADSRPPHRDLARPALAGDARAEHHVSDS